MFSFLLLFQTGKIKSKWDLSSTRAPESGAKYQCFVEISALIPSVRISLGWANVQKLKWDFVWYFHSLLRVLDSVGCFIISKKMTNSVAAMFLMHCCHSSNSYSYCKVKVTFPKTIIVIASLSNLLLLGYLLIITFSVPMAINGSGVGKLSMKWPLGLPSFLR